MKLSDPRRLIISLVSILLLIIHWTWPRLAFDTGTIILILIGLLPWLSEYIESIEAAGVTIKVRRLSKSSGKVLGKKVGGKFSRAIDYFFQKLPHPQMLSAQEISPTHHQEQNSKLGLLTLGLEVEKILMGLASRHEIEVREPNAILGDLIVKGILSQTEAEGLSEILLARNLAVHGASVEPSVAEWTEDEGTKILEFLGKK